MKQVHPQSLAAMRDELQEALAALNLAEIQYENARERLKHAQARHGAASLASINALIEIRKFIAENQAFQPPASERRSHQNRQGTPDALT